MQMHTLGQDFLALLPGDVCCSPLLSGSGQEEAEEALFGLVSRLHSPARLASEVRVRWVGWHLSGH